MDSEPSCHSSQLGVFSPGGWWAVSSFGEITGMIAIEMQNNSYIHALDSGLFTVGAPHNGKRTRWSDFGMSQSFQTFGFVHENCCVDAPGYIYVFALGIIANRIGCQSARSDIAKISAINFLIPGAFLNQRNTHFGSLFFFFFLN